MRSSLAAFAAPDSASIPLYVLRAEALGDWLETQPERVRAWIAAVGYRAGAGDTLCVPDTTGGGVALAVLGLGDARARARTRMALGAARSKLPLGTYHLAGGLDEADLPEHLLGWLLAGYRFDRFTRRGGAEPALPALRLPAGFDSTRIEVMAAAEWLTRDLINTPAAQMGPEDIVRLDVSMLAPGVPADIVERLRAERLGRFPCAMACTAVAGLGDVRCLVQIGAEAVRGA